MGKERRDRGDGAKFQRQHATTCGPKGVDCTRGSEPHGLWVARLELPTHTGKRRRKELTAATVDRLNAKLDAAKRQYLINGDLPTASHTVAQWMTYWLDNIAVNRVRPNTLAGYRSVSKLITDSIGRTRLEQVRPAHVRQMHAHMKKLGKSPTYALNAHRVLARALGDAQSEGLTYRNVAALTDAPRKAASDLNALTTPEVLRVLSRAASEVAPTRTGPYDPVWVKRSTYLLTGMRRGEVLGLEWSRVDLSLDGGHIDLSWQMQRITDISQAPPDYEYRRIAGSMYWTRPKSNAGWRIIPLVEPLRTLLEKHRENTANNPHGLVFTNMGAPIDPDSETDEWMRYAETEFGRRIRLHDTRHTVVDLLYAAGVSEPDIRDIVGHSEVTMTRQYRSKGNQPELSKGLRQLSSSLGFEPA